MPRVDGTVEWLVDDTTGQVVGQKLPSGNETTLAQLISGSASTRRPIYSQLLNGNGASYLASSVTLQQMIMVPSDFVALRIGYAHRGGSGGVTAAKFLVATTDDIGDLAQAQTAASRRYINPVKNGTVYNSVGANGWTAVTWNSSPDLTMADAGTDLYSFAWSDLILLKSEPLRVGDTARFAGCSPVLVRMFAGTGQYTKGGLVGFGSSTGFIAECGKYLQLGCAKAGDSVTTPSSWDESATVSYGDDKSLPIMIEAYTSNGLARTVLCAGDSRFASSSEFSTRFYRNLQFFIEQEAASKGSTTRCVSVSHGGQPTSVYYQRAYQYLESGFADVAMYLAYSINDGTPTTAIMDACKQRVIFFVDQCRKKGVTPLIVTAFPMGTGYTGAQVLLLDDLVYFVKSLGVKHIDPLRIYSGNASYGWNPAYQYDNSHMTDIGYQDLARRCYSLIVSPN